MIIFSKDEIKTIEEIKQKNDQLFEHFEELKKNITDEINPLFQVLSIDMKDVSSVKRILDTQGVILSLKIRVAEQINLYLSKRSKRSSNLKRLKQDKFLFYATGFGIKTNLGEKAILIDGHLGEYERNIELIENYVEFLRDVSKTLDSFGYAIKNMIDLMNYLGK